MKDRRSGEHWAGRMYMREISLRVDRYLVNTRVTPNQVTYVMTLKPARWPPRRCWCRASGAPCSAW